MGFWEKAAEVGKKAYDAVENKFEKINALKAQYENCSDEQLIKMYKNSSGDRKLACGMILKERGYGSQN